MVPELRRKACHVARLRVFKFLLGRVPGAFCWKQSATPHRMFLALFRALGLLHGSVVFYRHR